MTIDPLKLGFTPDEFTAYVKKLNPRMFADTFGRSPILGCVLHNTFLPDLHTVQGYLMGPKWNEGQLIENWWTSYRKKGWHSGPHIFVFPTKIYVATPLNIRGTHSPSYNNNYWGIEVVGDYSHEILPDNMRSMTEHVLKTFYNQLATTPSDRNLHWHGEDPATTHHFCPGKNIGTKAEWLKKLNLKGN